MGEAEEQGKKPLNLLQYPANRRKSSIDSKIYLIRNVHREVRTESSLILEVLIKALVREISWNGN